MKKILTCLFLLFLSFKIAWATTANIVSYEYWFDNDYANVVVTSANNLPQFDLTSNISTSGLTTGFHFFHIRFLDNNGNYSSVLPQVFNKTTQNNGVTTLSNYEYWYDTAYSSKISVSIGNLTQFNLDSVLLTGSLPQGLHLFHIRFRDNGGNWSSVISQTVIKFGGLNQNTEIVQTEYWFDNDYANRVDRSEERRVG